MSQNGRGGCLMGWRAGGGHGPARALLLRSALVVSTTEVAKPAQAAEGDHLDGIGPPPVPYMKKQPPWAGGEASFLWVAIEERLFVQKGFKPSKLSRR